MLTEVRCKVRLRKFLFFPLASLISMKAEFEKSEDYDLGILPQLPSVIATLLTANRGVKRRSDFAPTEISPVDAEGALLVHPQVVVQQPILGGNLVTWTLRKHQSPSSSGEVRIPTKEKIAFLVLFQNLNFNTSQLIRIFA